MMKSTLFALALALAACGGSTSSPSHEEGDAADAVDALDAADAGLCCAVPGVPPMPCTATTCEPDAGACSYMNRPGTLAACH